MSDCLLPAVLQPIREYLEHGVKSIWLHHEGAKAHDFREGVKTGPAECHVRKTSREEVLRSIPQFEQLFKIFPESPWTYDQIMQERPGKWEHSFVVVQGPEIVGFSFNSRKDLWLYVHAFFVAPAKRKQGIGEQLIRALIAEALSMAAPGIRLRVDFDNTPALKFYLSQGFAICSLESKIGALLLEKRL